MLIYATHNFAENYVNAIGAADDFMQQEMVIDEVARLVVENKKDVVGLLRKNSVNASINDSNNRLALLFAKYIGSDKNIRSGVVSLINGKSVDSGRFISFIGSDVYFSTDGSKNKAKERNKKFEENIKAVISEKDAIGTFSSSLDSTLEKTFTDKKTEKDSSPFEKNSKILEERVKLNELSMNATGETGWSKKKIILWGVGIAAIVAMGLFIAFKYYKKNKEALPSVDGVTKGLPGQPLVGTQPVTKVV